MSYANGPRIVTDGLVCCLDAANRKSYPGSGTTLYDLSGNGTNATLANGASFNSSEKGYITFNSSTSDYFSTSPGEVFYEYGTEITACAWFKRNGTISGGAGGGQSTQNVDNWSTDPATNVWLFHGNTSNTIAFYVNANNNGSYYYRSRNSSVLDNNTWYFICGTCSSSLIKLYTNGVQDGGSATGVNSGIIVNNSNSVVQYGKDPRYSTNRYFNGSVGQTLLYNRELSADEILQNFNATKGRFGL
jgi:hypothetical protein